MEVFHLSVKECPHCRLENPDSAELCDCGYDFASGSMRSSAEVDPLDYDKPKEKEPTDYTGLIIGAILAPVLAVFLYLGNEDLGITVFIVLGATILAIKIRWSLRKHVWFWATVAFMLSLHAPLVFIARWPHGKTPLIIYAMPLGTVEFLVIHGALGLAEKLFSKD